MYDEMTSTFILITVGIIIYFIMNKIMGVTHDRKEILYSRVSISDHIKSILKIVFLTIMILIYSFPIFSFFDFVNTNTSTISGYTESEVEFLGTYIGLSLMLLIIFVSAMIINSLTEIKVEIYQIATSIKQQNMPETQRILKLLTQTNFNQANTQTEDDNFSGNFFEKQNNQLVSIIQKLHEENKAVILAEREYSHLADLLILTNVQVETKVTPYIFNEHVYSYNHYKILKDAINTDTGQNLIDEKNITFEHQLKPILE